MQSDESQQPFEKIKEGWQSVKRTARDKQVYAGFARRTAATVIDWFWLNAIIFLLLLPPIIVVVLYYSYGWLPAFLGPDPGPVMVWIAGLCGFVGPVVLNWIYYAAFESSHFAATPGKLILGLRVTNVDGKPFSFWSSSVKQIMTSILFGIPLILNGVVSYLCAKSNLEGMEIYLYVSAAAVFLIPAIGYMMAIFDKKHQTVYDKMVARIVSVDPPPESADTPVHFFKTLPGKIMLAIVPVLIVALSTGIGVMVHRPEINPVVREALEAAKEWQALNVAKVQRKVIIEHTVKAGTPITKDDVTEVRVPSRDVGLNQVVCTDFVVGEKPIVTLHPGDFMTLRDLPYKKAQEVRQKIFAEAAKNGIVGLCSHAKNRSTAVLQEFRAVQDVKKGDIFIATDFVVKPMTSDPAVAKNSMPRLSLGGNTSKVNYSWEFAGKECKVTCHNGDLLERRSIKPSGKAFITTHEIVDGAKLTEADLREAELNPFDAPYTLVSDESLITGKRVSKAIPTNTVIKANDLIWR